MNYLTTYLFYFWLASLPFSWVIANYISAIAPDKMLAPLLIILGALSTAGMRGDRVRVVTRYCFLVVVFLLVKHISFIESGALYAELMWVDAIKLGYFIVPLLCIRSIEQFRTSAWIIVWVAVAGCVSVFLVSVGWLTLPAERFESSRLGLDLLQKAIGIFRSYGDLAQYLAFAVLWVVVAPGVNAKSSFLKLMRYIVGFGGVLGVLGAQSRNIVLSVLVALTALWLLRRIQRTSHQGGVGLVLGFSGSFLVIAGLAGFFANDLINLLSGIGGDHARITANARLEQYTMAWNVISTSPLLGADAATYRYMAPYIEGIHNIWLRLAAHGGLLVVIMMLLLLAKVYFGIHRSALVPSKSECAVVAKGYFAALLVATMLYVGMGEMFWALLGVVTSLSCIGPFATTSADKIHANSSDTVNPGLSSTVLLAQKKAQHVSFSREKNV